MTEAELAAIKAELADPTSRGQTIRLADHVEKLVAEVERLRALTANTDPWNAIMQGALDLACGSQRFPVLKTGEEILVLLLDANHGLKKQLRARLFANAKAVIDVNDDYEWRNLTRVLAETVKIDDADLAGDGWIEWGLSSKNPEVAADAEQLRKSLVRRGAWPPFK